MVGQDEQIDRREARRTQIWTAIIAATSPVVVALITLGATGSRITSDATAAPQPTVTVTRTVLAPSSTGGSTSGKPTSDPTQPVPAEPKVRQTGILKMTSLSPDADLDATDKTWCRNRESGDGVFEGPSYISAGGSDFTFASEYTILDGGDATYQSCADAPDYVDGNQNDYWIPIGQLEAGTVLCVHTSADRYARLLVRKEPTPRLVEFDVTVWERA